MTTEPTHILVAKLRRELDDTVGYLVAAIANGELFQGQVYSERISTILGVLEALLDDQEEVFYS
jgi:hypothetical protein